MKTTKTNFKSGFSQRLKFSKENYYSFIFMLGLLLTLYSSCKKSEVVEEKDISIDQVIKAKLLAAGFDLSQGFSKYGDKYIVENDIILSVEEINNLSKEKSVVDLFKKGVNEKSNNDASGSKGKTSHYVGNNLLNISSNIRTINIFMDNSFGAYLQNSLDSAIHRYNTLELGIVFNRTTNSNLADIMINPVSSGSFLMSAGFPSNGNPYNEILVNTIFYNSSFNRVDAISTLAHEIGHCIGFRHTDFMNRVFSCGNEPWSPNEGGTANHISGTDPGPSSDSWMLACSNGTDRQFTLDDILSLKAIYPRFKDVYVRQTTYVISDESYTVGCCEDHTLRTRGIIAEFYQDAGFTIPYTTTNNFVLRLHLQTGYSSGYTFMLVPNGVNNYYVGEFFEDSNSGSSGYTVVPFFGAYHFP